MPKCPTPGSVSEIIPSREDHREKRHRDNDVETAQGHGTEGGQIDHDGGKDQIDQVNRDVEHAVKVEGGAFAQQLGGGDGHQKKPYMVSAVPPSCSL